MLSCRILLAAASAVALVAVTGASGEPINSYSATGSPTHVKPSTSAPYTIALTNDALSRREADRAKIGIPAGFVVVAASVQAAASAAGECLDSTWVADGTLIADGNINLKRPAGAPNNRLCPGATLTVAFSATSSTVEGAHSWGTQLIRAEDAFVLNGAQPTVNVDGTGPVVTLTSHPPDPSNDTSPSFGFSASEPASFACKLDGGSFSACTSPKGYSGLADGTHTLTVRATDAAGNTGQASYSWLVETDLPVVTLTEKPPAASSSSSARFEFTAGESATFECRRDSATFAPCTSPTSYSGLADGSHTFAVRATDTAGNTGPATTYTWTVDTVPPVATITAKPASQSSDASPTFAFSASETVAFKCRLDAGEFAACSSPRTYIPGDGSHTFTVRATDAAGNVGEASYSWTIDTVVPTVAITGAPNNPSNVRSPAFSFSASEGTVECRLDGGSFAACASPKTYSNLADGTHTFTVRATDAAGNTGQASHTWLIETDLPIVTLTGWPPATGKSSSATFTFTASEPGTFACSRDGGTFASCTSPVAYSGLSEGSHTFAVRATDTAGNTGPATTYTWTVDTVPPVATIATKPASASTDASPTFAFSANEAAVFECKLDAGQFTACSSPTTYTLGDGSHTFTVRATDAAGNAGDASYSWTIDTVPPNVTLTHGPPALSNNPSPAFGFSASETVTFECSLDGGSFAPCSAPKTYNGLADGSHAFVVRATDAVGFRGEATHGWTVDTVPPTSAITQTPGDPTNSRSATFAFSASESASFQCKVDDAAFTACASPQVYSDLRDGRHTFAVRAIDAASNVGPEAHHAWTIEGGAPVVTIIAGPDPVSNSTTASFSFAADEPAAFQCSLDDRGFEPCSSPASYAGLRDGSHAFVVRATDAAGNVGAASRSWTIDVTAPETTLDSRPAARTTATSAAFRFSSSDAARFECRIDGGAFSPCTSPKTYAGLANGLHRFAVRAIDAAGNVDPTPATAEWTVARVTRTAARSALFAPAAGARVTRPPLLRWRAARRATYYNVQLYRAGRKVLSAWPTRTSLQLRSRWRFDGKLHRLEPGLYRWYVWPGYGPASARRYGSMLGTSTFVVTRAR